MDRSIMKKSVDEFVYNFVLQELIQQFNEEYRQEIKDTFTDEGGYSEFGVAGLFKVMDTSYHWIYGEREARKIAIKMITRELMDEPEKFDPEWLMGYVDHDIFHYVIYDGLESYVNDLASEPASSNKFKNRQEEEIAEAGYNNAEEYTAALIKDALGDDHGAKYMLSTFGKDMIPSFIHDGQVHIENAARDIVAVSYTHLTLPTN